MIVNAHKATLQLYNFILYTMYKQIVQNTLIYITHEADEKSLQSTI